jgi:hypothetical protein
MKNLRFLKFLYFVIFLFMLAGTSLAADPCDTKPYRVCGASIEGETVYVVHYGQCREGAIQWYILDYIGNRTLDEARKDRDLKNASEYAKCETDRKYEQKTKVLEETVWIEIK